MTPRESIVVERIERYLVREYGAYEYKTHGSAMRAGLLDITACIRGRFVAIEVKAPGALRGVTTRQRAEMMRIMRAGGIAFVARTVDDVIDALREAGLEPRPVPEKVTA